MSAPSKADICKLVNATQIKPNQQSGTEPHARQGNELCEAEGRVTASRNAKA